MLFCYVTLACDTLALFFSFLLVKRFPGIIVEEIRKKQVEAAHHRHSPTESRQFSVNLQVVISFLTDIQDQGISVSVFSVYFVILTNSICWLQLFCCHLRDFLSFFSNSTSFPDELRGFFPVSHLNSYKNVERGVGGGPYLRRARRVFSFLVKRNARYGRLIIMVELLLYVRSIVVIFLLLNMKWEHRTGHVVSHTNIIAVFQIWQCVHQEPELPTSSCGQSSILPW